MIHNTLDNRKIVLFGNGTVRITSAYLGEDEKGILSLNASERTPIGSSKPVDSSKTISQLIEDMLLSEIVLEFENIKSLEVLILKLQEVRAMMLGYDIAVVEEWKKNNNITAIYQPNLMIDGSAAESIQRTIENVPCCMYSSKGGLN